MRVGPILKCVLILLVSAGVIKAQETDGEQQSKGTFGNLLSAGQVFLDADIGIRAELGFLPPSSDFGMSFELPVQFEKRIEIQGAASFSPDKKKITGDGHSISASGKAIFWINPRLGAFGEAGYGRLWTSQFDEGGGITPTFGAVIRTHYFYPGRLYISYSIPTGCVSATATNPCKLQSKRLQGFTFRQEFQFRPHIRWGIEAGAYHYCAQGNPEDPAAGRKCLWAGTELLFVRFQFPGSRPSGAY
jgi:hypothetical protein